jgi:hypothetical protein
VGGYAYITLAQLRAALMLRLQDVDNVNVPVAEANIYLTEAMRVLNAQTQGPGIVDFAFDFNPSDTWKSLNVAGSPRQRTVTDTEIYSQIEAMLYEPMSGGVWTGTNQFNIQQLANSLQYRRDELLLASGANTVNLLQESPLLSTTTILPDSTLDLQRVRWLPSDSTFESAYALGREDVTTRDAFGVLLTIEPGPPESWMITANAPLQFDCSRPPNQPGTWDMLVPYSGMPFVPPASTLVGIPDDWTPTLVYGVLADVLANSPEGRDESRAKYALQRYEQLKKAMVKLPWLLAAEIGSIPVDTPSFKEMDAYAQNWEQTWNEGDPQIVVGGVDLIALAPNVSGGGEPVSTLLTVVGNAPIPSSDASLIQLDRAGVDAVLGYSQHVAMFKQGGKDFFDTIPLFEQFEEYCRLKNRQYAALGIFRSDVIEQGGRGESRDPRFGKEPPHGESAR